MSRVSVVWGVSLALDLLLLPVKIETHVCIRGVHYCRRCDRLYIPTALPGYTLMTPQMSCHFCHQAICGGWLAALLSILNP